MRILLSTLLTLATSLAFAQSGEKEILQSWETRKNMGAQSILKNYPVRNIGPTVQGGRIVDIEVNHNNMKEFYLGFASAGIFKTENNGISFEPIFDNQGALGVGDFALSQSDPKIIYVGTGEKNSSRSSYAGTGIYKTSDGGKSWAHLGLTNTQHVSRVIIHPQDNNVVWVAAIGALYTPNAERGVYKTTDGGKSWKKTLFINDSTGIIDLVINPQNPNQLLASAWERSRSAMNFKGNGEASAIYRSEDGGNTWTKSSNGFASGKTVGRIGLDVALSKPNICYAILDNQAEVEDKKPVKQDDKIKLENVAKMSKEEFLKLDDKKIEEMLRDNGFPKKYNASAVKADIRNGKYTPKALGEYFGADANQNLFRTKILGAEMYRSEDFGKSWKKVNSYDLDGVYFTYGYYFSELRVDPNDANLLYIYGVPMLKSRDGGATWHRLDTLSGVAAIHVDHHALWINPKDSKHLLLGNDGGLYQSYDEGANWRHINNMSVGQFYTVNVDMETPYNVYGGLQDNGVLKGSSKSIPNVTPHWEDLFGGDGMYVAPDPRNSKLVYTGFQFGNYYRLELDKNKTTKITPQHNIGEAPLRWNWRTPLFLSKHNPDIVYIAANKVFRSFNRGESWEVISGDLTKNHKQGNVPFSTIASLNESPLKFGLLYAGTDDGNVWRSDNGGATWTSVASGLPANLWISSITPSPSDTATVFVTLNGYRNDDFRTYVFSSKDYGKSWTSVKGNLPESVANVLIQDPVNSNLLYCGLDNGTYASLDFGKTWHVFTGMLNVASYDMMVHPRDNELVVGTHGRSIYVADVKPLQALKDQNGKQLVAFAADALRHSDRWGEKSYPWAEAFEPSATVMYFVSANGAPVTVELLDEKNNVIRKTTSSGEAGFNKFTWDVKGAMPVAATSKKTKTTPEPELKYVAKGKYKVKFSRGADTAETTIEIK